MEHTPPPAIETEEVYEAAPDPAYEFVPDSSLNKRIRPVEKKDTVKRRTPEVVKSEITKTLEKKPTIELHKVVLDLETFEDAFYQLISETLKLKKSPASLKREHLSITDGGNHLEFNATLETLAFNIKVSGSIVDKGDTLGIADPLVTTKVWGTQGKAQREVLPLLGDLCTKLQVRQLPKYYNGKKIDSMTLGKGSVILTFEE
jgi:hypothetical protein